MHSLSSKKQQARLAQSVERETLSFHVLTRHDWLSQGCGFDPHVGLLLFCSLPKFWVELLA